MLARDQPGQSWHVGCSQVHALGDVLGFGLGQHRLGPVLQSMIRDGQGSGTWALCGGVHRPRARFGFVPGQTPGSRWGVSSSSSRRRPRTVTAQEQGRDTPPVKGQTGSSASSTCPEWCACVQGREGKVVQVYRRRWVIHIERLTREKVNGAPPPLPPPGFALFEFELRQLCVTRSQSRCQVCREITLAGGWPGCRQAVSANVECHAVSPGRQCAGAADRKPAASATQRRGPVPRVAYTPD